jgi:hypothetical protein
VPIELAEGGEKFSGVDTLLSRMKTHPEEFFEAGEKRGRWAFIYRDYFKDCLTESEKGRIHEALRVVRRWEFDALVVKELMREEREEQEKMVSGNYIAGSALSGATPNTVVNTTNLGTYAPSPFGAVPQGHK